MASAPQCCPTHPPFVRARYGTYRYEKNATNNAAVDLVPTPSKLVSAVTNVTLLTRLYLGARADNHKDRHFKGRMALVQVFSDALPEAQAQCLFTSGDTALPSSIAQYRHSSKSNQTAFVRAFASCLTNINLHESNNGCLPFVSQRAPRRSWM